MKGQTGMQNSYNTPKAGSSAIELKLRVAEYIAAQYDYDSSTDVRSILNETKIGARTRSNLQKMLNSVFTTS